MHIPLKTLHAIEVFENTVYLAPWSDSGIVSMDKYTMAAKQIAKDVNRAYDFRIFHRQKQPEGKLYSIVLSHACILLSLQIYTYTALTSTSMDLQMPQME